MTSPLARHHLLPAALAVTTAALAGCGAGEPGAEPEATGAEVVASAEDEAIAACPRLRAGDYTRTLSFGGRQRRYLLHVPPRFPLTKPLPLVFAFHGGGGTAAGFENAAHLAGKADAAQFLLVEPDGTSPLPNALFTWNAGSCCGTAQRDNVDDVGFVRAMIEDVASITCLDRRRVYATGHSNGGMLSHRLACEASDVIAAIAPVGGGMGDMNNAVSPPVQVLACNPSRPVPVLHMHGLQDGCYRFEGGPGAASGTIFSPVPDTIEGWIERNGCTGAPEVLPIGAASCFMWTSCRGSGDVALCVDPNAGHTWLGSGVSQIDHPCIGPLGSDLHANDLLWTFFSAYSL